jgi:hypothetical protein
MVFESHIGLDLFVFIYLFISFDFYLLLVGVEGASSYSVGLLWTSDRPVAETST